MPSVKFVAFGCPHAPLQDNEHIAWICEHIRQHKPDYVICLGDLHEMDSASRWPSEYDFSLQDEYKAANNDVLKPVRLAAPKNARCVLLPGNHDDNLMEVGRVNPKIRELTCWKQRQWFDGVWINEELLTNWNYKTPYEYSQRGVFRLGQVSFIHGYEASQAADEYQSILLGVPNGLTIAAHTHKPTSVGQACKTKQVPLPYWYANAGCSRIMDCGYMARKRQHLWGQGLVLGACEAKNITSKMPTTTQWDAETIVRKMYS